MKKVELLAPAGDQESLIAAIQNGADAILAGHLHQNNASILYEGVRLVFGTKSSRYDKYAEDLLGGTIFTVTSDSFTVAPVYYIGA